MEGNFCDFLFAILGNEMLSKGVYCKDISPLNYFLKDLFNNKKGQRSGYVLNFTFYRPLSNFIKKTLELALSIVCFGLIRLTNSFPVCSYFQENYLVSLCKLNMIAYL